MPPAFDTQGVRTKSVCLTFGHHFVEGRASGGYTPHRYMLCSEAVFAGPPRHMKPPTPLYPDPLSELISVQLMFWLDLSSVRHLNAMARQLLIRRSAESTPALMLARDPPYRLRRLMD